MTYKQPNRNFQWISAVESSNLSVLEKFEASMVDYYSNNSNYYTEINFTADNWKGQNKSHYHHITNSARTKKNILEIGCGRANILNSFPELAPRYTGIDFSQTLITKNQERFPAAVFQVIKESNVLPVKSESYDMVFSIFVLEHCVFPQKFLSEAIRVLKPGGTLFILCPDFCGRKNMTSQRVGFGPGSGRQKISQGHLLDGFVTMIDNRVRQPLQIRKAIIESNTEPRFYINIAPTCFEDSFYPDCDAVYLTNELEIRSFLSKEIIWKEPPLSVISICRDANLIFLEGIKLDHR